MLTMRPLDERGAWAAKSKKEYDLDENGERIRLPSGRYKTHKIDLTGWNDKDNTSCGARRGLTLPTIFGEKRKPERIDHRSNAERGIDEIPTVHMGVAACQMEKKGIATEKGELNRNIQKANRLIREIRAQIGKLKEWIADLFKARETAPEQPPQSPNLANLLMKYLSVQREKSRKYSQSWQHQHAADELKTIAAAVNYLSEHGISNLDELDDSLSSVSDKAYSIREGMKTAEQRMKELQKLLEHGRNYQTYKPIQDEYRQIRWKGKQEKFAEARRAELTLWDAANRYLHANLTDTKTLPISKWKHEYADLKEQRDTDYTKLKATRAEVAELQNEYRWKRHDSLTIRGNKWYRHSQSKGGGPVDFVMEFFGKSFTEAVELLTGEKGAAPPPDRPSLAPLSDFRLPPRSTDNRIARNYLTAARRIDEDVTGFFFSTGDIYEEAAHHNAVFVGRDESGIPRYAHQRGTAGSFRLDVKGSDKAFNFCYRGEDERLFVFEAPIDLLSFLCLFKKDWQKQSYLALGGVGEKALLRFLSDRPNIKTVYLCLDSDEAGNDACSRLAELVPEGLTVHRLIPLFKDWNEVLQHRAEITDGKYLREAIYGLKEPPQEETVEIIRMSEVDTQTVEWLWEPYIPFGKVTIVQGNPGEGKTTFALRLAAACTTGGTLPGMKPLPPFQVIYQTAEDGLGDTVKPRLIEAAADLDRVLVIDEAKRELTLSDERIEKAITQNGARLIILDPIQAYMGEKTDMNRANEVRPMFRRLADVAERTGCAVILIGHLNKAAGGQSAYRGLGSIDFRAAARSVLLIGRVKREPNVRVIVHDKSSLAPEGKPVAFCLDPETGFEWIGEYDITADELLSGAGGNTATKTEQAERLILDLLADGKELASEDIVKAAAEAGISERTVQNAKRNMGGILGARRVGGQWYNFIKKKQPPEPAS